MGISLTAIVLAGLILLCWVWRSAQAGDKGQYCVGVVLSERIRPYHEALLSFEEVLRQNRIEVKVFELREGRGTPPKDLQAALLTDRYLVWAAIGPQATEVLWSAGKASEFKRIYGMVLNPHEIIERGCGVPLNIPIPDQVETISRVLPRLKKVGVLFDPRYNGEFIRIARQEGAERGLQIVPVEVSDKAEIKPALERIWTRIDALWLIPDPTVISESLVRYVIKEGLANQTATIGYNRFFCHSGAAMSFVLDYAKIGQQMALLCLKVLRGGECVSLVPFYEVWLNARALEVLGLEADLQALGNISIKVIP